MMTLILVVALVLQSMAVATIGNTVQGDGLVPSGLVWLLIVITLFGRWIGWFA